MEPQPRVPGRNPYAWILKLPKAERDVEFLRLDLAAYIGDERPGLRPFPMNGQPYVDRIHDRMVSRKTPPELEGEEADKLEQARAVYVSWFHDVQRDIRDGESLLERLERGEDWDRVLAIHDALLGEYESAVRNDRLPDLRDVSRRVKRARRYIASLGEPPVTFVDEGEF